MEFNLYLRDIIFVTNVAVQTIETIKLVFKPLSFDAFEIGKKRYLCLKGNIQGHKRMLWKSVVRCKTLLTTQVQNLHVVSYYSTKTFSSLNYAQDFGTIVKWLQIRSGLHSWKVELSRV